MPNQPQFGFVIEYVKDIDAATRFFTDVLGLKVERSAPNFVQFEHFAIASDEPMGGTNEPEVYWLVDDVDAAYADLSGRAQVSMPLKEFPFGKVFGVQDADGRPRYLLQLSANRPSRPVA